MNAIKTDLVKSTLKISEGSLNPCPSVEKVGANFSLQEKGCQLVSKGKFAMVLVVDGSEKQGRECDPDSVDFESTENKPLSLLQMLLSDAQRFVEVIPYFGFHLPRSFNSTRVGNLTLLYLKYREIMMNYYWIIHKITFGDQHSRLPFELYLI